MAKVAIDLQGKDNASRALQSASARLVELRTEIDKLRSKGAINLTVADSKNLSRLTSEASRLERALQGVNTSGVQTANGLSGAFGRLQGVMGGLGLGGLAGLATGAGVAAAVVQVGKLGIELGNLGSQSLDTKASFDSVLASIGGAPELLNQMTEASSGTISQLRMMQLTNTALAGSSAQLGQAFATAIPSLIEAARAANKLNPALGDTEFLFQSLVTGIKRGSPMLIDNTGITLKLGEANEEFAKSIGKTADELTEEEKKLALLNATMEGADRLVQQAGGNLDGMTTSAQQLTTAWDNLKAAVGEGLAPAVSGAQGGLAGFLTGLTEQITGIIPATERYASAQLTLADAEAYLASVRNGTSAAAYADYEATLESAQAARDKAAADAEVARVMVGVATGAYNAGSAELDYAGRLAIAASAARDTASAERELSAARSGQVDWTAKARSVALIDRYQGITSAQSSDQEETARGYGLLRTIAARKTGEKEANQEIADDYYKQMNSALEKLSSEVQGKLGGAISASIGLGDMTPGDANAPGANGPFEALFRAQSIAVHGTGGDNEKKWAEMYGLTQESAKKIVTDFQAGLFTPDVVKLIDVNALTSQIQGEQAAAESTTKFAQFIAGQLGVKDAGSLVASQTFQAIAGGVNADPTQQANAANAVLGAYANNVQTVVTGSDFAGRMIGFGTQTWEHYETGLLEGAKSSQVFVAAVNAAIAAFMAAHSGTGAPRGGVVSGAQSMGVPLP